MYQVISGIFKGRIFKGRVVTMGNEVRVYDLDSFGRSYPIVNVIEV